MQSRNPIKPQDLLCFCLDKKRNIDFAMQNNFAHQKYGINFLTIEEQDNSVYYFGRIFYSTSSVHIKYMNMEYVLFIQHLFYVYLSILFVGFKILGKCFGIIHDCILRMLALIAVSSTAILGQWKIFYEFFTLHQYKA